MQSSLICPISEKTVDESVVRLNAALVVLLVVVFGITQSIIPLMVLVFDFFVRAIDFSACSPLRLISLGIVKLFSVGRNPVNAGPKIFAARLGFAMVLSILLLNLFGSDMLSLLLAGMLVLLSFLEAGFGLCVACKIYPVLHKLTYRS